MFANTNTVYASAIYLAIRVMYVDPDALVFYAGIKSLYMIEKGLSQLT